MSIISIIKFKESTDRPRGRYKPKEPTGTRLADTSSTLGTSPSSSKVSEEGEKENREAASLSGS
jgi:hypothetical protein